MIKKLFSTWDRLTTPLVAIDDEDRRFDAQALASLAILVLFLSIIFGIVTIPLLWTERVSDVLGIVVGTILFIVPYFLSRYDRLAASVYAGAAVATTLSLLASSFLAGHRGQDILYYLITVVVFAASFLSIRMAAGIMLAYSAVAMVAGPIVLQVSASDLLAGPISFNLIGGTYILIFVYHWKRKEKRKQKALQISQSRYRMISELTSDYTFYHRLNQDGTFTREWVTDAFEHISGYKLDELPGERVHTLYHPDDIGKVFEARRLVNTGQHVEDEMRMFRKNGEMRWLLVKRVPHWNADNTSVIGHYGAVVDITERRRAEEQRLQLALQQERFALLNQFVQAVSHDFRTRLSRVESARYVIGKMLDEAQYGDRVDQSLAAIRDSVFQMNTQIANLSLITAVNNPKPEKMDVRPILIRMNEHYAPRASKRHIDFILQLDDTLPTIHADEPKLNIAFTHLIENAMAHTMDGGRIILCASAERNQLLIEVSDNGEGIAADQLVHIFEPFYKVDGARTASRAGLGLGLTIVKMVIDAHDGQVDVESMPGVGSTFRV
ncbi:MAG: PAS domain-containing protein, partial [Anaerolineae bacterium]|nr:PAS domain-containing protein [Anaerolineae bacterium]